VLVSVRRNASPNDDDQDYTDTDVRDRAGG
jgi:hypothetical protein